MKNARKLVRAGIWAGRMALPSLVCAELGAAVYFGFKWDKGI